MPRQRKRVRGRLLRCLLLGVGFALGTSGTAASLTVFGSPLQQPATLNTAANLAYYGTYTPVLPGPEAPNGVYHTNHWGVDTALWNVTLAGGLRALPRQGRRSRSDSRAAPSRPPADRDR